MVQTTSMVCFEMTRYLLSSSIIGNKFLLHDKIFMGFFFLLAQPFLLTYLIRMKWKSAAIIINEYEFNGCWMFVSLVVLGLFFVCLGGLFFVVFFQLTIVDGCAGGIACRWAMWNVWHGKRRRTLWRMTPPTPELLVPSVLSGPCVASFPSLH